MKSVKLSHVLIVLALLILPPILGTAGGAWVRILDFALLYILLALGLNIVVGFTGLLDLGFIAFYAVGAYLYALFASPHLYEQFAWIQAAFPEGFPISIWLMLPLAGLVAAIFGVLLGAPTLKLRGDYLAIVTLGFGEIVRIFLNNLNAPINITNGPQGLSQIEPLSLFGVSLAGERGVVDLFGLSIPTVMAYYYVLLAIAALAILMCYRLVDSRTGRAWKAIREDEIAAKAMGINTRNMKLLAFATGAAFGGVSGSLFASFQGFVSPESFTLFESIVVLAMVVLGGLGNIRGVVIGAALLAAIPEALRLVVIPVQEAFLGQGNALIDAEVARQFLYGTAMVGIMLWRPSGLIPGNGGAGRKVRAAPAAVDEVVTPELVTAQLAKP